MPSFYMSATCKAEPLIFLRVEGLPDSELGPVDENVATRGGGRLAVPRIDLPKNSPATPAFMPQNEVQVEATLRSKPTTAFDLVRTARGMTGAAGVAAGAGLAVEAFSGALIAEGVVLLGEAASIVWESKQVLGMSFWDTLKISMETPYGPYENYLDPNYRPIDPEAEILSAKGGNGLCTREFAYTARKLMDKWCDGAKMCRKDEMGQDEIQFLLFKTRQCFMRRIDIMDKCFKGGDLAHRAKAREFLNNHRSCQKLIQ